jgi:hypothetical protein
MNVQLSNVLSDVSGASGMAIIHGILKGERDARVLAALADAQVKASKEVIAKSLKGNWRQELLFVLAQEVELYGVYQDKIAECDRQLQTQLRTMAPKVDLESNPLGPRPKGKRAQGNAPKFDLRTELYRLTGVDWTQVNGIDVTVAQSVIAETGVDLSPFPSEGNFTSWMGLCPANDSSSGRVIRKSTPHVASRAATAFRQAASALIRSQSYLGAQYRRLRTRLGAPKAITAMARKLACLFYRLLRYGQQYVDKGMQFYEEKYRDQQIKSVTRRAQQLGLQVIQPKASLA